MCKEKVVPKSERPNFSSPGGRGRGAGHSAGSVVDWVQPGEKGSGWFWPVRVV